MREEEIPKALLVIDVQENLVNPASRMHIDTTNIELLFNNLNQAIRVFEAAGWPVIYVVNEWSNPLLNWLTGNVCKKGGKGTGLDPRLRLVNDKVYKKSVKNALSNEALVKALQKQGIKEVYVAGLFAEHCVKATLADALKRKFEVTVISDALGSKNDRARQRSVRYYQRKGATMIPAAGLGSADSRILSIK